jgi:DNA excision repair protein ERCC-4
MTDKLPALKSLSELSELSPVIIIDTREQYPLPIRRFSVVRNGLQSGDYSVSGLEDHFAIERKSISDLVGCCMGDNRERFERELHRLRGYRFKRLLIIGSRVDVENGFYRSNVKPQSVLASLDAWEVRYDVPVVFAASQESGAGMVEDWVWRYSRHAVETANGLLRGIKGVAPAEEPS